MKPYSPHWGRRRNFVWQLRFLVIILIVTLLTWYPPLNRAASFFFFTSVIPSNTIRPVDPCLNRPSPAPLPRSPLPTLFFLHIPKTAGTLMYTVALQYAYRTNGLSCEYITDGNRAPPFAYTEAQVPMAFASGTREARGLEAIRARDFATKESLLAEGVCRTLRGHVTVRVAEAVRTPVASITIMRDPIARFVSMYEFVISMVRRQPNVTGWDAWLGSSTSLAAEFANSSSIVHRGFYNDAGRWITRQNIGFSFHFYGVLHQLSGLTPRFKGVQDPRHFGIRNDAEMAEAAKDNLCRMHVVGMQEDMEETWRQFFEVLKPFANWTEKEKSAVKQFNINRTPGRIGRNVREHLPLRLRRELERRLAKEIEVFQFAKRIVEYRKWLRASAR